MGGGGNGQIIKYVGSKNCRAWSCMHIIETTGGVNCTNVTVSNNGMTNLNA